MPELVIRPKAVRGGMVNLIIGILGFGYFLYASLTNADALDLMFLFVMIGLVLLASGVLLFGTKHVAWSDAGLVVESRHARRELGWDQLDFMAASEGAPGRFAVVYRPERAEKRQFTFAVSPKLFDEAAIAELRGAIMTHRPDLPQSRAEFLARRIGSPDAGHS